MEGEVSWYPGPPVTEGEVSKSLPSALPTRELDPAEHPIWQSGELKYLTANRWQSIPMETREETRRHRIHGVEIKLLPSNHFLHGEYGLYATKKFSKFDILGEYTGKIVGSDTFGHYVAALEDTTNEFSLGIDAQTQGSELRFINSYLNVAFKPNLTMRTVYINTFPHIVLVCMDDIEIGDEFLLDYGDGYNQAFLLPKKNKTSCEISNETFHSELPGFGSDNDTDSDGEEQKWKTNSSSIKTPSSSPSSSSPSSSFPSSSEPFLQEQDII